MGRESMEMDFADNIDRMLAGEEVSLGAEASEDYRSALSFARKMIELRPTPSAAFATRLKVSLLPRLSEQEAKRASIWASLWHNPIWRALVPIALVVVLAVGVLWGAGILRGFGSRPPVPAPAPTIAPISSGENKITLNVLVAYAVSR